jgi:protein-disulfide isomerase
MQFKLASIGTAWRTELRNTLIAIYACFLMFSSQPSAADMTDSEFEDRLRTYILAHPELILEAMETLSERERLAEQSARIAAYRDIFEEAPVLGIGPDMAEHVVIEFFDYRCAPCKAVHPKLQSALKDHPNVRVEMRHLPILSPGSERAARFALAAKKLHSSDQYRVVHEALWTLDGPLREPIFKEIAEAQGLDWPRLKMEMQSDSVSARIDRNRNIAIDLEILGTPAFVTPTSVRFGLTEAEGLVSDWLNQ